MDASKDNVLASILEGGILILGGLVLTRLLGFLYNIVIGRYLGPEAYGIITVMISVLTVSRQIGVLGLPTGVQRFISRYRATNNREAMKDTFSSGFLLIIGSTTLLSILLYYTSTTLAYTVFNEPRAHIPIIMAGIALPLFAYRLLATKVVDAFEQMGRSVAINIVANGTKVAVTAVLVWIGYGYIGASFAYVLAIAAGAVVAAIFANKCIGIILPSALPPKADFRKVMAFSLPLLGGGIIGIINSNLDILMLQTLHGTRSVGLYQAAHTFAMLLPTIPLLFSSILLSTSSRLLGHGNETAVTAVYHRVTKWITILVVPLCGLFLLIPRPLLALFGVEYTGMTMVLRILSLGLLARIIIGPSAALFKAHSQTRLILYRMLAVAIINGVLNLVLIPRIGITGAAVASAIANCVAGIYGYVLLRYKHGIRPFKTPITGVIGVAIISGGIGYAALSVLPSPSLLLSAAVITTVFCVLYTIILLSSTIIDQKDIETLYQAADSITDTIKQKDLP